MKKLAAAGGGLLVHVKLVVLDGPLALVLDRLDARVVRVRRAGLGEGVRRLRAPPLAVVARPEVFRAVGEDEVRGVVPAQPGDGPGPGVVDEERGVGLRHPARLVARVGAAEALIQVGEEPADERVRLALVTRLPPRHAPPRPAPAVRAASPAPGRGRPGGLAVPHVAHSALAIGMIPADNGPADRSPPAVEVDGAGVRVTTGEGLYGSAAGARDRGREGAIGRRSEHVGAPGVKGIVGAGRQGDARRGGGGTAPAIQGDRRRLDRDCRRAAPTRSTPSPAIGRRSGSGGAGTSPGQRGEFLDGDRHAPGGARRLADGRRLRDHPPVARSSARPRRGAAGARRQGDEADHDATAGPRHGEGRRPPVVRSSACRGSCQGYGSRSDRRWSTDRSRIERAQDGQFGFP